MSLVRRGRGSQSAFKAPHFVCPEARAAFAVRVSASVVAMRASSCQELRRGNCERGQSDDRGETSLSRFYKLRKATGGEQIERLSQQCHRRIDVRYLPIDPAGHRQVGEVNGWRMLR